MKATIEDGPRRRIAAGGLLGLLLVALAGCATYDPTRDDRQSDLPWNEQQSWEGTVVVPGMTGQ